MSEAPEPLPPQYFPSRRNEHGPPPPPAGAAAAAAHAASPPARQFVHSVPPTVPPLPSHVYSVVPSVLQAGPAGPFPQGGPGQLCSVPGTPPHPLSAGPPPPSPMLPLLSPPA